MKIAPGIIRDSIVQYLLATGAEASTEEITTAIRHQLGDVPSSSIRSYLSLNTPITFERTGRGKYRLAQPELTQVELPLEQAYTDVGQARLYQADCFDWLAAQEPDSVHAIVTDPPYGLVEYTAKEKEKLRSGKGGVWRIPPSFDGHQRAPLPRFTTLNENDLVELHAFFLRFGRLIRRVAVPGANVVVAANPLLSHIVADAMTKSGLEMRGYIARQVMTMRGGDRPKNAHEEFEDVSVMPRSQWEPWVVLRKPLDGRVQDNLRRWGTGGFRRISKERPFGDVIKSHPTPAHEKKISPHPSLKPQGFMRQLVRAVLPLGNGVVLDPFMGGGSTMAAANAVGYQSYGIEMDPHFFELAKNAIPLLTNISAKEE
jgi:DNA modification methylase